MCVCVRGRVCVGRCAVVWRGRLAEVALDDDERDVEPVVDEQAERAPQRGEDVRERRPVGHAHDGALGLVERVAAAVLAAVVRHHRQRDRGVHLCLHCAVQRAVEVLVEQRVRH